MLEMARIEVFAAAIILVVAFKFIQYSKAEFVSNSEEYSLSHINSGFDSLEEDTLSNALSPYVEKTYKNGNRTNDDHLLARDSNSEHWSHPKYVKLKLRYPKSTSEVGFVITYLEIVCNQSTPIGQAYMVSGGIVREHIAVIIEAPETLYFSYEAEVYGYGY